MCLAAVSAHAVPYYWDHDLLQTQLGAGQTITGTFNIAGGDGDAWDLHGFDGSSNITSAIATFSFLDLNLRETKVKVDLGVDGFAQISALVLPIFVSGDILGQALVDLSADGILAYTVTNTGTTGFRLMTASLVTTVPDGGTTLSLLGLSLVATALAARRKRSKQLRA